MNSLAGRADLLIPKGFREPLGFAPARDRPPQVALLVKGGGSTGAEQRREL